MTRVRKNIPDMYGVDENKYVVKINVYAYVVHSTVYKIPARRSTRSRPAISDR